jgi:DNA-binding GntR family transcriptional regulator
MTSILSKRRSALKKPGQRKAAISRDPLHIQVAGRLRDMIVHGDLTPGVKVPFATLAETLGVSLTPLREAFKVLAEEGLVEQLPNRGVRILPYTAAEASALFEVIAELESLAAALAASRISPDQLAELETLHAAMGEHFRQRDKDQYFDLNSRIHETIVALSGNEVLIGTHTKLMVRANRGRYIAIIDEDRWREAMAEHDAVMEAFRSADSDQARRIWRIHLTRSGEVVADVLGRHESGELKNVFR